MHSNSKFLQFLKATLEELKSRMPPPSRRLLTPCTVLFLQGNVLFQKWFHWNALKYIPVYFKTTFACFISKNIDVALM